MSAAPYVLAALPGGIPGIKVTLQHMVRFARKYKKDIVVRDLACKLTQSLPSKDYSAEVRAIYNWVKTNVRYVRDVDGVETLQTPKRTLEQRSGDCDDHSTLVAALLASIGHPVRFIALGFNGEPLSHVVAQTKIANNWITLDTTVESATVGWFPPGVTSFMVARL